MNGGRPENIVRIFILPHTVIPLQMVSHITIKLDEIIRNVNSNKQTTIEWLAQMGMIGITQTCEKCNYQIKIYNRYY